MNRSLFFFACTCLMSSCYAMTSTPDADLLAAIAGQNVAAVTAALECGADVTMNANKPLYEAVVTGNISIVHILLTHGADIHARNEAMLRLAVGNNVKMAKLLHQHGARLDALEDSATGGALYKALARLDLDVARFLIEAGANVNARNVLSEAAARSLELTRLAIKKGANVRDPFGTAVLTATQLRKKDCLVELLKNGAPTRLFRPALEEAVRALSTECACTLLAWNTDPSGITIGHDRDPHFEERLQDLAYAYATAQIPECQRYLADHDVLRTGTDWQKEDVKKNGVLAQLIKNNETEVEHDSQALLHGQTRTPRPWYVRAINHRFGPHGQTVLMWAVMFGFADDVKTLLEHGAQINVADSTGRSVLALARMSGNEHFLEPLVLKQRTGRLFDFALHQNPE